MMRSTERQRRRRSPAFTTGSGWARAPGWPCRACLLAAALAVPALAARAKEASAPDGLEFRAVEPRWPTQAGRLEVSLSGLGQVNGAFTDHLGIGLEVAWHLDEDLAVYAGGTLYPVARESAFADQLLTSASLAPNAQGALLVRWDAGAGVELSPIHGKLTWGEEGLTRFVLFVRAGGGVASTRIWLAPSDAGRGPLLGDAGLRLAGTAALGVRIGLTDRLGLRAELRADVFSARVQKVDGCSDGDLSALAASGASARVASGCDAAAFARDGYAGVRGAQAAVEGPSSGLAAHVALQLGVGYLF